MQEGSLRADVNVSVMEKGSKEFGTRTEMKNINQQKHLLIGSTESNASTRIIPFLLELNKDFPNMTLELITNTTKEITKKILDYKLDIAFISGLPKNDELMILEFY